MGIGLGLGIQFYKKAGARLSAFLTWGQSVPARFWGTETPEYWGGIDPQAQIAYDSLIAAGFTTPQGLGGINAAFSVVKEIYGTSDITTAISFFGDPSLAYEAGAGSGTTLGQAIRTLPNIIDPTRATDAVQTTAASQPLLLVHEGANYYFTPNCVTNNCSTPNAAANQITGDYEVVSEVNFINASQGFSGGKYSSTAANSGFYWLYTFGQLYVGFGSNNYSIITSNQPTVGTRFYYRIRRVQSTGVITLERGVDGINFPILMATISGASGAMPVGTSDFYAISGPNLYSGVSMYIYRMTVSNSIGGAPVVDFNPNQYNPSTSQTQWTSSTGELWTINTGTATTGYKGVLVDRTMTMFDAIDDTISNTDTTTFRTTFVSLKVHRTGSFFAGVINNNTGSVNTASQWFYTDETANIVDANNALLDTRYINNVINSSYTPYRLFLGQIDLGATPNTANGKLIGFLAGNNYLCGIITSCIQTYNNPTPTQRTSMYNYIRSINNAAF